ncbi:MAG: helix-turn-helix transcriptional regulator [Oscillospiraceae bacterium]|nr:helix-turn-helix transcriptional regulator [Oscillospiraceae bacterium]
MSNLYKILTQLCAERQITPYRMCKDTGIQPSVMTDLKKGRRQSVRAETAAKLANYFDVTVNFLLGGERESAAAGIPGEKLKFALFGGEATDEQLEEVRQFARFVRERDASRPE